MVARSAPPSDDGSPARLVAAMVGIVGILLLGSLAWSAVGALVSAVGSAASALSSSNAPPAATLSPPRAVTPTPNAVQVVAQSGSTPTVGTIGVTATVAPTVAPTAVPTPQPASTPAKAPAPTGRNPWILLPQPEPGARVSPGQVTIEARGRGDAPITALRIELDGSQLNVSLEQRSESTWRGFASVRVAAGDHAVRASVTDAEGRAGSFRWSFSAAP